MMQKIKNSHGAVIILIVLMLVILFPLIMSSVIDLGNIYLISEQMKVGLNAAVKSGSTLVDWSRVPHGEYIIDVPRAKTTFIEVLASNMKITNISAQNNYFRGVSSPGEIRFFAATYNNRHMGTFVPFPAAGSIPPEVTEKLLQVNVDRPTVFAVATVDYRLMPLFGGRTVRLTRYASSQLNQR